MLSQHFHELQLGKIIKHKVYFIIKYCISYIIYWIYTESENNGYLGTERLLLFGLWILIVGGVAGWELWLKATAEHHQGESHHTQRAWGKIKTQNPKYGFYWMSITFASSSSQKLKHRTVLSQEVSVNRLCLVQLVPRELTLSSSWSCEHPPPPPPRLSQNKSSQLWVNKWMNDLGWDAASATYQLDAPRPALELLCTPSPYL